MTDPQSSREFWYLVGVSLGDGSFAFHNVKRGAKTYRNGPYFRLNVIDREFAEETKRSLEKFSQRPVKLKERSEPRGRTGRYFELRCGDVSFVQTIGEPTDFKKKFPDQIFDLNRLFQKSFVAGLIDSEGRVEENKRPLISTGELSARRHNLSIKMTDLFVLEGLREVFHLNNVRIGNLLEEKPQTPRHRVPYLFSINVDDFINQGFFSNIPRKHDPLVYHAGQESISVKTEAVHKVCLIEGCNEPHHAYGLCSKHATAFKRGKLDPIPKGVGSIRRSRQTHCSIDGCENKHAARGYCHQHYTEFVRNRNS